MFWKRKTKFDWGLLFFGLVALAIILAMLLVIITFVDNYQDSRVSSGKINPTEISQNIYESALLVENTYKKDMEELFLSVKDIDDVDSIYNVVEESFYSVRVPEKMRDLHLQTLLDIFAMQEDGQDFDLVRTQVMEKIDIIIKSLGV